MSLQHNSLSFSKIETTVGELIAIADEKYLYFLGFMDSKNFTSITAIYANAVDRQTYLIKNLQSELKAYFKGELKNFNTPISLSGTAFQQQVWQQLQSIPYGSTISYSQQAAFMGINQSTRAIANANGKNPIIILVPCHRVIRKSGDLGGYSNCPKRKKWFIELEQNFHPLTCF